MIAARADEGGSAFAGARQPDEQVCSVGAGAEADRQAWGQHAVAESLDGSENPGVNAQPGGAKPRPHAGIHRISPTFEGGPGARRFWPVFRRPRNLGAYGFDFGRGRGMLIPKRKKSEGSQAAFASMSLSKFSP